MQSALSTIETGFLFTVVHKEKQLKLAKFRAIFNSIQLYPNIENPRV